MPNVTRRLQEKKKKPSRFPWTGTTSMSPICVNGVEITYKNTFIANCVVFVGRFFSINRPWSMPTLQQAWNVKRRF